MHTLLFALMLAFPQTSPQAPREASVNTTSKANGVNEGSGKHKGQPPAPLLQDAKAAIRSDPAARQEKQENNKVHAFVDKLPDKDGWDKTYICLTGALVLLGFFTLIAIWYQAVKTAESVDASKIAAEAAKNSAESAVNIERGWLMVESFGNVLFDGNSQAALKAKCKLKNFGRTPLFVIEVSSRFVELDNDQGSYPVEYWKPIVIEHGLPVPPGEEMPPIQNDLEGKFRNQSEIYKSLATENIDDKRFLHFYGYVRYRDALKTTPIRETFFYYVYRRFQNFSGFVLGGPPGANRHT